MRPQWMQYKKLELIPEWLWEQDDSDLPPVQQWIRQVRRSLTCRLLQGEKPAIWQTYDRNGKPCCMIYDPSTGHTVKLHSDEEFLTWFNRRFCERPHRRSWNPF